MTTSELSAQEIFRAVSTLENSDKIFAALRKGCKNVDAQGLNERFAERYRQTKKNFFSEIGEKKMKRYVMHSHVSDGLEELWIKCLELFGSDYSRTYREFLNREKNGEKIEGFYRQGGSLRHNFIIKNMPESEHSGVQNVPKDIQIPKRFLPPEMVDGEYRMSSYYQSHSENSLLTLWSISSGHKKIVLELNDPSTWDIEEVEKVLPVS